MRFVLSLLLVASCVVPSVYCIRGDFRDGGGRFPERLTVTEAWHETRAACFARRPLGNSSDGHRSKLNKRTSPANSGGHSEWQERGQAASRE